jgi:hypothetical protein
MLVDDISVRTVVKYEFDNCALDCAGPLEDWQLPVCFNTYRKCLQSHRNNGTKEYVQVLLLLNNYSVTIYL